MMQPNASGRPSEVERLSSYHTGRAGWVVWAICLAFVAFVAWANTYKIDEVARATGEVIASSRVQIIQSVDGGVISNLHVREGDRVKVGQVIAELDETRVRASMQEMAARLGNLSVKAARLTAEVTQSNEIDFPELALAFPEQVRVETALFLQRRDGYREEMANLNRAVTLASEEAELIAALERSGDVNRSEVIRTQRALNDAEAKLISRKNRFFEEANQELTKAKDEIAQTEQVLTQRRQQLIDSVFRSKVDGIVKNVRVTTVGGVLRAGEELMQIIPVNDELIVEAKVSPEDIARVHPDLTATIRFDPFDYTIYGGVDGTVQYVSADTLKEEGNQGTEIYYRVHVTPNSHPVVSSIGRELDILPGMTAQVDIQTGSRTVMDFLLKPIRKTISESFGER
ncbi:MAG: HlyD family type I secretion periplasmic adaptor subunit [Oceanobacter sp.]